MAILSKGNTFATGEQVTATKLNNLVDNATFASGAVDDSTTALDGNGKIIVKDSGITSAKLNLSATGSSQDIITFKAIQGGTERKFHIRTPASTNDFDSPFEFFTANAFKFLIDSNQIVMDETGQLGVGVASPSAKLDVIGNLRAGNGTQFVQLTSTGSIELNHSGNAFIDFKNSSSEDFDSRIHANSNGLRFDTGGDGSTANRMTITSDGDVGIGTTSPSQELHVVGTSGDIGIKVEHTGSGTSDDTRLDFKVNNDDARTFIRFGDTASNEGGMLKYDHSVDAMTFFTANSGASQGSEKVRITNNGNVGIGTTSPDTALHIENTSEDQITLTNTSGNLSRIQSSRGLVLAADFDNNSGATQSFVSFETDNSERMRIIGSKGIAVGQTTTPTSVAGSIFAAGRIGSLNTFNQPTSDTSNGLVIRSDGLFQRISSSARYKNNIEDYTKGIDEVKLLRPVSFQSNNEDDDKTYAGLIAEEVHDAGLTEFVSYNEEGQPDSIAYPSMVSLLTKALQESITKIEALEAKVAALES
mgnify:CR=1 FL=1|tara:strand:+ start:885 stop:2477 length:1593 start_codon:yes stop_codon:yes gene_type:complete